jgi:hypothetical protein
MKRSMIHAAFASALGALTLSGCYIVPIGSEDLAKVHTLMQAQQPAPPAAAPAASAAPGAPASIPARLYPVNDIATENGMLSGTVTNMMNGKGRLQLTYRGEPLVGEATRVANDERKGVASAWGPNGSFMTCEYQMSSPVRGAGTCSFSDGARYQVHVGN